MKTKIHCLIALAFMVASCRDPSTTQPEAESGQSVGNGVDWDHASYVNVSWPAAMGAGVGSGTFVEKQRCVLTAGHNGDGIAAAGRGAVLASTIKGAHIDDNGVPYDFVKPANIRYLKDSLPMASRMAQAHDVAFMWTDGAQNLWGRKAAIHGRPGQAYTPVTIGYGHTPNTGVAANKDDGTRYFSLGYGHDCVTPARAGVQRYGFHNAFIVDQNTTGAIAGIQVAAEPTRISTYGGLIAGGPARWRFCMGDSGSALEIYELGGWQIVGVEYAIFAADGYQAANVATRAYQPWFEDAVDKWCNPMHRVSVRPTNEFVPYSVTGVASTDVLSSTIIQCDSSTGDDCSQNCGADETGCATFYEGHTFIEDHADWLPGTTGTVTLTANSVSGACFVGWRVGPQCPCQGWQPGQPFSSSTCVLELNDTLQPDTVQTEDTWLSCAVDYVETSTGGMGMGGGSCPPSPVCYDGICEPGESCTFGMGCGAYDCGSCDGYCGDHYCAAIETSTCVDCTCGDDTCQGHETCSNCGYDCGDCATCGDGNCDVGEENWCVDDCASACGDMICDLLEDATSCPSDC